MPYSEQMPALVYPNTDEGRKLGAKSISEQPDVLKGNVYYCLEWRPKWNNKAQCANAHCDGYMNHNMCFRCIAGYLLMNVDERDFDRGRIGVHLNGYYD